MARELCGIGRDCLRAGLAACLVGCLAARLPGPCRLGPPAARPAPGGTSQAAARQPGSQAARQPGSQHRRVITSARDAGAPSFKTKMTRKPNDDPPPDKRPCPSFCPGLSTTGVDRKLGQGGSTGCHHQFARKYKLDLPPLPLCHGTTPPGDQTVSPTVEQVRGARGPNADARPS